MASRIVTQYAKCVLAVCDINFCRIHAAVGAAPCFCIGTCKHCIGNVTGLLGLLRLLDYGLDLQAICVAPFLVFSHVGSRALPPLALRMAMYLAQFGPRSRTAWPQCERPTQDLAVRPVLVVVAVLVPEPELGGPVAVVMLNAATKF